jgi:rod shape-determining protein MreC
MSDETVPSGELVLTSGGDGIFPKGLLVGRVEKVTPGSELFLNIRVRPAANLGRLEEVLVVTKIDERQAQPEPGASARAIDILAGRLPGVPSKPEAPEKGATPSKPDSEAKPQTVTPQASNSPSSKDASASSQGTAPETSASALSPASSKVSAKPVKAAGVPKPQPAAQDSPN